MRLENQASYNTNSVNTRLPSEEKVWIQESSRDLLISLKEEIQNDLGLGTESGQAIQALGTEVPSDQSSEDILFPKKPVSIWSPADQITRKIFPASTTKILVQDIPEKILPNKPIEAPLEQTNIYTIKSWDTLYKIAEKHNVQVNDLKKRNNLTTDNIYPGQNIIIPEQTELQTGEEKNIEQKGEDEWEKDILASLEKGIPLNTHLGSFVLGKKFIPGEAGNVEIIKQAFNAYMKKNGTQYSDLQKKDMLAYMIGTAKLETDTFAVLEEYADGSDYNPPNKVAKVLWNEEWEWPIYKGRGYVQITGENNYEDWSEKFFWEGNKTILTKYRSLLLLNPDISATILVKGMMEWSFTGKDLPRYLGEKGLDFINARRTVNGRDRREDIAKYATEIRKTL
jgi:LysM repeat protein